MIPMKRPDDSAANYLVGRGIASLAAVVFLIRDADQRGHTITILKESSRIGGSGSAVEFKRDLAPFTQIVSGFNMLTASTFQVHGVVLGYVAEASPQSPACRSRVSVMTIGLIPTPKTGK